MPTSAWAASTSTARARETRGSARPLTAFHQGRPQAAVRLARRTARRWGTEHPVARGQLSLLEAAAQLEVRPSRRHAKAALAALDQPLDPRVPGILAAEVRVGLIEALLRQVARLRLQGDPEAATGRLQARVTTLQRAETLLLGVLEAAPTSVLVAEGVAELGAGWHVLGDDLVASPAPKGLSATEEAAYRAALIEQAATPWRRAANAYRAALTHLQNLGHDPGDTRYEAIEARLHEAESRLAAHG